MKRSTNWARLRLPANPKAVSKMRCKLAPTQYLWSEEALLWSVVHFSNLSSVRDWPNKLWNVAALSNLSVQIIAITIIGDVVSVSMSAPFLSWYPSQRTKLQLASTPALACAVFTPLFEVGLVNRFLYLYSTTQWKCGQWAYRNVWRLNVLTRQCLSSCVSFRKPHFNLSIRLLHTSLCAFVNVFKPIYSISPGEWQPGRNWTPKIRSHPKLCFPSLVNQGCK